MIPHRVSSIDAYPHFNTSALREKYLVENLFSLGEVRLIYTDLDRAIVGASVPLSSPLALEAGCELKSDFFCQRRELGIINLGGDGQVSVDGKDYCIGPRECLYVGKGSQMILFSSKDISAPANFYFLSYPAHKECPTTFARISDSKTLLLGSKTDANERHLHQYIYPGGIESCQLVMGITELQNGSAWNTMPPHTHDRRSEIYCYFDITLGHRVAHFMGEPSETRVLWINEKDVVLSPSWSIHCGAGTNSYSFVWGMGGENQRFDDMDAVPLSKLR